MTGHIAPDDAERHRCSWPRASAPASGDAATGVQPTSNVLDDVPEGV
jgi:hypothetical protein